MLKRKPGVSHPSYILNNLYINILNVIRKFADNINILKQVYALHLISI